MSAILENLLLSISFSNISAFLFRDIPLDKSLQMKCYIKVTTTIVGIEIVPQRLAD
jgi:hypothetical protein